MSEPAAPTRRRPRTVLYVALGLAAVIALLVGVLATRKPASDRPVYSALIGKPAPDISGTTIDGQHFQLSQFAGRWVLVNFFATWCAPCQKEHPEILAWSREHADAGDGEVVAVVYGDDASRVRDFFARNGGDWPVLTDDSKEPIAVAYGVTAPPESYLITPGGTVAAKLIGGVHAHDLDQIMAKYDQASGVTNAPATSVAPTSATTPGAPGGAAPPTTGGATAPTGAGAGS